MKFDYAIYLAICVVCGLLISVLMQLYVIVSLLN